MKYDFDKVVERRGTGSTKWDKCPEGCLPMWIADMDFEPAPQIREAVVKAAQEQVYGYTERSDSYNEAVKGWMESRHGWNIESEWMCISPGIIPALNMIVKEFANPGDKIVVQQPVYYPFFNAIKNNGCEIVNNPLVYEEGSYRMDFEDLERKLADSRVRILIISNPHNPVGRVWTKEELERIGELCLRNGVLVVSDEIHADVTYKGFKHTPFASIFSCFAENSITCTSPSKSFNIAGIQVSNIIIPNEKLRARYQIALENTGISRINIFGLAACEAAYACAGDWLDRLLEYLEGNIEYVEGALRESVPGVELVRPQGTYLAWLDFRRLGLDDEELEKLLKEKAGLMLNQGTMFGKDGSGFARMNIACPRSIVEEAVERLKKALA